MAMRTHYCGLVTEALVTNLGAITTIVKSFGEGVAIKHPGKSFYIFVSVKKGSRKPNGFDAMNSNDALGQAAWMQTVIKE